MPKAIVATKPAALAKITVEWLQLLPGLSSRDTGGVLGFKRSFQANQIVFGLFALGPRCNDNCYFRSRFIDGLSQCTRRRLARFLGCSGLDQAC